MKIFTTSFTMSKRKILILLGGIIVVAFFSLSITKGDFLKGLLSKNIHKPIPPISCLDSDGGLNYYEAGSAYGPDENKNVVDAYYDSCSMGDGGQGLGYGPWVVEKHCSSDGKRTYVHTQWYKCASGCYRATCLDKPMQSLETSKLPIVFLYTDTLISQDLIEKFTNKSWYKANQINNNFSECSEVNHCYKNNVFFGKEWAENEAKKYGADLLLNPYPFNPQQQIKFTNNDYELFPSGAFVPTNSGIVKLFKLFPELKKIKYISLIISHSDPSAVPSADPSQGIALKLVAKNQDNKYYVIDDDYNEEFLISWLHEFFHLLGASDKYGSDPDKACIINPKTGEEYDYHDLFCHRLKNEDAGYGFYNLDTLKDIIISEPTAKEIGWIK